MSQRQSWVFPNFPKLGEYLSRLHADWKTAAKSEHDAETSRRYARLAELAEQLKVALSSTCGYLLSEGECVVLEARLQRLAERCVAVDDAYSRKLSARYFKRELIPHFEELDEALG